MSRVLPLAIASIAAIVASTMVLDWFVASIGGGLAVDQVTFDLREARACSNLGPCGVVPMSAIDGGMYGPLSTVTFWGSLVFALAVIYQVGSKLFAGSANETITKGAYALGSLVVLSAVGAGYLFGPDVGSASMMGLGIEIERSWGPLAMLAGVILGNCALYYTREDEVPVYKPIEPQVPLAVARTKTTTKPEPLPVTPAPRRSSPTTPPPSGSKIQFATIAGELSVAGIDARRAAGGPVLVLWRDVVGLVVRRLPPELEGHVFLDVVSTAGMTLRILPWTKLTGERIEGDAEARVRALLALVKPRCPEAKLDRATQAFLDGTKAAAQLPSVDMLAKHDQALA